MAQVGYTPISLYYSATASAAPSAGNLANGELALNITDGRLFYKDNGGVVQVLATKAGASGDVVGPGSSTDNALVRFDGTTGKLVQSSVGILSDAGVLTGLTGLTSSGTITFSSLTSGRVPYLTTGGALTDSANLNFNGSSLGVGSGSTSLWATLTVVGNTLLGNGAISTATDPAYSGTWFGFDGGNNISIIQAVNASTASLAFYTKSSAGVAPQERLRIGATGAGTATNDWTFQGITVGRGAGAVATNTAVGASALAANTTGSSNAAFGLSALAFNTTGTTNSAFGFFALRSNTTGSNNTAVGEEALWQNTTASNNTAVGYQAGYSNTTGTEMAAFGYQAGYSATTAIRLTAIGYQAAKSITTGGQNTAVGTYSLFTNTTGTENVSVGEQSMYYSTTGSNNTAVGKSSLSANTTGNGNVAIGHQAGYNTTTGGLNVFVGRDAGLLNTVDQGQTFVGFGAGRSSNANTTSADNTCIGAYAGYNLTTGSKNTYIGGSIQNGGAGYLMTSGSKNTILGLFNGNQGGLDIRTASNWIVLSDGDGNPRGYFNASGTFGVGPNVNGGLTQLGFGFGQTGQGSSRFTITNNEFFTWDNYNGSGYAQMDFRWNNVESGAINVFSSSVAYATSSDYRLKDNPQPLTGSGEFIDSLKPKTWTWKDDGSRGVGFIAHEVQEVSPSSVIGEKDGMREDGVTPKYQSMEYGSAEFIANIILELQSLRARVAQLETKGA